MAINTASGLSLNTWISLEKQNIAESNDAQVLALPSDQTEVNYLSNQGLKSISSTDLQALANLNLGSISPAVNSNAQQILKKPPFAPKDVNMFSPLTYPNATPSQPAAAKATNDCQLRAELLVTLVKRFRNDKTSILKGLTVYDDPAIKSVVPDSRMRAGLAMLKGTAGDAAIDAIKSGAFSKVEFGIPPVNTQIPGTNAIAQSVEDGSKRKIIINSQYQYEDPKLLGTVLSHETLHSDPSNSNKEELMNNAIEAMVYGQLANEDPGLARSGTELTRRYNTKLMALVNSRDANGNIHILSSNTDNVYPGTSQTLPYFGAGFVSAGLGADTPGNAALRADLSKITKMDMSSANFDMATLNKLDQNINLFTPSEWVRIANILKLNTSA